MSAPDVPNESTDPYVLVGGAVYLIGSYLLVGFAVLVGLAVTWIAGLILSVNLAKHKADIPKWLWVASLVLTGLYLLLLAILVVAMFV